MNMNEYDTTINVIYFNKSQFIIQLHFTRWIIRYYLSFS